MTGPTSTSITTGVILDARTQPGYAGKPIIQISGELAGADVDGLRVGSQGSTIRGLVISNFTAQGIQVTALANHNVIVGNYVGTDLTGTLAKPNPRGILLRGFNNTIGGTAPEDRNVIAGNASTNPSLGRGIEINGAAATANVILGNYIGVNAAGTAALANTGDGIAVVDGAHDNTIGGDTAGSANVISGNIRVGIWVNGPGTYSNVIQGNLIGTDAAGTAALGNGFATDALPGIMLDNAPLNTVGGAEPGAGNVISANKQAGVTVTGSSAYSNRVLGNRIGTTADGAAPLGNVGPGVLIINGASYTVIGSNFFDSTAAGNVIAFNGAAGIAVGGDGAHNVLRLNSIHDNAGIGIDLGNDGVTPNDLLDNDTGPNDLQNAPVIDAVTDAGGGLTDITGRLFTNVFGFAYVDLYASPAGGPADVNEGARYLGVTFLSTDQTGQGTFTFTTDALAPGEIVTATATANYSTSEFSDRVSADPGGPYAVTEGTGANGQVTIHLAGAALDLGGDGVTYAWDLDEDGQFDDSAALDPTVTLPDDGPAQRVVSLRVTNSAGQTSVNSTLVQVVNANPAITDATVNNGATAPTAPGTPTTVSGHFTDPGLLDTHTATIDWGDGTTETVNLTRPTGSADGAFSFTHTYATGGIYGVFISVTDDDGGQTSAFLGAYVTGAGIQNGVLNVVGTNKSDLVTLTVNPDGSVNVAASFLNSPATFAPTDFYYVNVTLGPKNDQASVVGAPFFIAVGIDGGDGNDTLNAGVGYTYAYGGPGNDLINGSNAPDAQGGYYVGADGNDVITGGAGDDFLFGEAGNDVLHGNAGNGLLSGDLGTDLLNGGPGTDTWLDPGDTSDTRISLELP